MYVPVLLVSLYFVCFCVFCLFWIEERGKKMNVVVGRFLLPRSFSQIGQSSALACISARGDYQYVIRCGSGIFDVEVTWFLLTLVGFSGVFTGGIVFVHVVWNICFYFMSGNSFYIGCGVKLSLKRTNYYGSGYLRLIGVFSPSPRASNRRCALQLLCARYLYPPRSYRFGLTVTLPFHPVISKHKTRTTRNPTLHVIRSVHNSLNPPGTSQSEHSTKRQAAVDQIRTCCQYSSKACYFCYQYHHWWWWW